ncbi:AAA domain-containing protein [Flexithrix dorotheae]|uniref:AAA domain-containing protein n=1 Tax=Flexithrix dorotheae TaxID=70993 RepID=UPI00036A8508|nr:AAA domain-containing protein [Flexithrix dorotheae]
MKEPQRIIKYLRECYIADQREQTIWNIFDKKIEERYFMKEKEELVNGFFPKVYIEDRKAIKISKILKLYRKEKKLYYYSFFIAGKTGSELPGRQNICAPLFYYPAQITQNEEFYYVNIDFKNRKVNLPLLSFLSDKQEDISIENFLKEIPKQEITFENIGILVAELKKLLPQVDFEESLLYPSLVSNSKLQAAKRGSALKFFPASVVGIQGSSRDTRGVLNELQALSQTDKLSSPLREVLGETSIGLGSNHKNGNVEKILFPGVLSNAQNKILASAQKNTLNLIIGPPGTGKSYTISALAIDHIRRGKSVLIASRMDHAVDVIGNIIQNNLGLDGCVMRAGRSVYLKDLKQFLQNLLSGISKMAEIKALEKGIYKANKELKNIDREIEQLEKTFTRRSKRELKWTHFITNRSTNENFLIRFINNIRNTLIENGIKKSHPLWESILSIENLLEKRSALISGLLKSSYQKNLNKCVRNHRNQLNTFLSAIRARTDGKQEDLMKTINFSTILEAFPVWLVNLADVYDVLPMHKELFDLAIIDEATQCDIPSCLPIFQRAKKVVITGDPHQLRHVSFLARTRQTHLAEKHKLSFPQTERFNYREKSVLDLVNEVISNQEQVVMLDEHYRSLPGIISYSNQTFYNNALHVMTQSPISEKKNPVEVIQLDGKREKRGVNVTEANWILARVQKIIDQEDHLSKKVCHSIGILSPFRDQVDYIANLFHKNLQINEMEKHEIAIGTAHSFQGEERDMMFLSFVFDETASGGTFTHLNKDDIFNVAVTRARVKQFVVISTSPEQIPANSHLKKYLEHASYFGKNGDSEKLIASHLLSCEFANEVSGYFKNLGFNSFIGYPIAGLNIDLLLERDGKLLGIDLIGYPGVYAHPFELERYQMLQRAGLQILPLTYLRWENHRQECSEVITGFFE